MMDMRVLTETQNCYSNMAEDAALIECSHGPVLRLYTWRPSAVSIGYFQSLTEEVNEEFCRDNGIDVVRRMTGGGAVFHDEHGEVTYSFLCPLDAWRNIAKQHGKNGDNVMETYELVCNGVIQALKGLGMNASFRGINDIEVNGKKISGSAQTRKRNVLLQHGTLICRLSEGKMFKALRVGEEKISDKGIKSADARVTSLEREIGCVDNGEVMRSFVSGFSSALGIDAEPSRLSAEEEAAKLRLIEQFKSRRWNYQR
jgi:lipoate-protein ligase A